MTSSTYERPRHRVPRTAATAGLPMPFVPAGIRCIGRDCAVPPRTLHAAMADQLEAQALQGAVWALVAEDGAITVDAAGTKDARHGQALRSGDRVHVGSVAKTLLATGVLRLVSQQRLALDTPVSELLPAVAFDNPWAASDPVRVRHLLDHTAGLDDARFSQVFSLKPSADTPLAEAFAGQWSAGRAQPAGQSALVLEQRLHAARNDHRGGDPVALRSVSGCASVASPGDARQHVRFHDPGGHAMPTRVWPWGISRMVRPRPRFPCTCDRPDSSPPRRPTWAGLRAS